MAIKKKKILHILKSSIYSGAENVVILIIKNLKNEYDFTYVATDGPIRETLLQEKIPFLLLNKFSRRLLNKVILEFQPDIIHAHDFSAMILCASIKGKFQLISHLHYDPPWVRKWNIKSLLYAACAMRANKILVVSGNAYSRMVFSRLLKNKALNIGNPIDIGRILSNVETESIEQEFDLIFVGRLVEQKNPERFLRIVKLLTENNIVVNTAMLGDGELYSKCEEIIRCNELNKQAVMLGFKKNPYPYIKKSKILCMTSRWEGYGLVALEANILGIPVLSSRTSGIEEILGQDADEICDNNKEFIQKVKMLLFDDAIYYEWKEKSKERALRITNISEYMEKMSEIYQRMNNEE